jgi:putative ABC transport system substrate-binding protein
VLLYNRAALASSVRRAAPSSNQFIACCRFRGKHAGRGTLAVCGAARDAGDRVHVAASIVAAVIGLLVNPKSVEAEFQVKRAQLAARALGLQNVILNASSEQDFEMVFSTFTGKGGDALVITGDALFTGQIDRLVALTAQRRIPAIYSQREFAEAGGLMGYGTSITDAYRQVGIYTSRILKGERPGDLPIVQPTKFEFVLNLKTAKALGLNVPLKLHAFADDVIE